jgi:hypothetical protein
MNRLLIAYFGMFLLGACGVLDFSEMREPPWERE